MNTLTSESAIFHRKKLLFQLSVFLMFFTSMSKVLVPGAVFDQLQFDLELDAAVLGGLNAWYMSSYAISQFSIGMIADRWGGPRVLLLGSLSFCLGMMIFPLTSTVALMRLARCLAGFGAGIVFLGSAKLVADLYPEKFSSMLGFALVISYLGPVVGTAPMVWLVKAIGWRLALLFPAVFSLVLALAILFCIKGTMSPVTSGESVLKPVLQVMCKLDMLRLFLSSSIVFGSYYALLTIMGRKCLEDATDFPVRWAPLLITLLTLIVAFCNLFGGTVSKAARNHYGLLMSALSVISLAGAALGWITLKSALPGILLGLSYILICIPAGFFPVYSTMAKDNNPPERVALAVALVNFWAFVMISLVGYLAGLVMRNYEHLAQKQADVLIYPATAYQSVFVLFIVASAVGLASSIGLFRRKKA